MTRILISGSSGFIGHNLVDYILRETDWEVVSLDRLGTPLSQKRWNDLFLSKSSRIKLVRHDLCENISNKTIEEIDYILHLGAETNINKSIKDPHKFIKTNVFGTYNLLEFARREKSLKHFIYVSTNEVFGHGVSGEKFGEWNSFNCLNPYSATKAASEDLSLAYSSTYQTPVLIIRTMNLFGNRQDPKKFIPTIVRCIKNNIELPIYVNSNGDVGTRSYLHVSAFASALFYLIDISKNKPNVDSVQWNRDKFNIAGEAPINNLMLAKKISEIMGKPLNYKLIDYYSNQPAHELHSSLDCARLFKLGWSYPESFDKQLENSVVWLMNNSNWFE